MYSHYLTICLTAGLTLFAVHEAAAQQPSRNHRAGQKMTEVEQLARTRWQPTRRPSANAAAEAPQSASTEQAVTQVAHQATRVRRTQATGELPAPKPMLDAANGNMQQVPLVDMSGDAHEVPMQEGRSVMQSPAPSAHPTYSQSYQPMDGEIIYETAPYHGEVYEGDGVVYGGGCDSMGCDCGGMGCDGGCDSMGCCGDSCGGSCGPGQACDGTWRPCLTLCFPQDGWASFEYLMWNQRGMNLPPLVTTSNNVATTRANAGVLGLNTTDILFGGERVLDDGFNGGRLQFGFWLDKCHTWGIGAEYFQLSEESESFSQRSTGNPILARPFFNVLTGREDSELVAFPNVLTGSVSAEATSQLTGAGVHLRHQIACSSGCGNNWMCGGCGMVHSQTYGLLGYRFLQLDESVSVTEDLISTDTTNPGTFLINDRFETRNQFNGVDLGLLYNRRRGLWSLDLLVKLAVGNTHQQVQIRGTTRTNNGAAQTGGLLAQTSNIGTYERDEFSVVPEFGITGGYHLTRNFKLKAGYSLIFWSNVVRPGDQIDLDVNPNFLPPPAVPFTGANRPHFDFVDSDYYVHGANLGAELTW